MEGSISQNPVKKVVLAVLTLMVAISPLAVTFMDLLSFTRLILGLQFIFTLPLLFELIRVKIQKLNQQMEEDVSYFAMF